MRIIIIILLCVIINFIIVADLFSEGRLHRAFWADIKELIKGE